MSKINKYNTTLINNLKYNKIWYINTHKKYKEAIQIINISNFYNKDVNNFLFYHKKLFSKYLNLFFNDNWQKNYSNLDDIEKFYLNFLFNKLQSFISLNLYNIIDINDIINIINDIISIYNHIFIINKIKL